MSQGDAHPCNQQMSHLCQPREVCSLHRTCFFHSVLLLQGVSCKTPLAAALVVCPLLVMSTIQKQSEKGGWVQLRGLQL